MPDASPVGEMPIDAERAPCPVVGVGASAGGLEAFSRLLRHMSPDTAHAVVFVQHLDATHPSSLSELLGRATTMPVVEAAEAMAVVPGHVYVIAPNTELTIADGRLRLAARSKSARPTAVDCFFESLAAYGGRQAVGIVLSGNGADGAVGLRAIKDAGGVTFAQDPDSAEYPSMPSAAIGAGGADLVLAPESIALELARLVHHPFFDHAIAPSSRHAPPELAVSDDILQTICDAVHAATGVDFLLYRQTTIRRRILRRLAILNVSDADAYARLLHDRPDEIAALQRDLLIGVTSFFRDPKAFDALKTVVFPLICRGRPPNASIRIWVPGCATGEEAYSILIALLEYQRDAGLSCPVHLFASDINDVSLETARRGRYPESIAAEVSPQRLANFFVRANGMYEVAKHLREQCLFSRHNLLDDPPFSRLDLVSCRNVLIYVDSIQRKVIPLFHYALLADRFLMLGRSETTHHDDLFTAVDPLQRIYVKRQVARRGHESFVRPERQARGEMSTMPAPERAATLSVDVDRLLLARYGPSGVLVDDALEVLEFRGRPAPFLAPTAGKAGLHLLKHIADTELFLTIERLIRAADATGDIAWAPRVAYEADGRAGIVSVEVTPLQRGTRRAFLVLFGTSEGEPGAAIGLTTGAPANRDAQVAKLTRDLEAARARLMAFIDDKEVSDGEQQQVAEDALSQNEELQSLTEELETAKEELQSTNEELLTVNRELESRNAALASALELTRSIVQSVAIPLIVIDGGLVVRQMNPAFLSTFHLAGQGSEDQSFFTVCDGVWNLPELHARLGTLLAGGRTFDPIELERAFPALGLRTVVVGGVRLEQPGWMLLTVQDITAQREAEKALRTSEERRRQGEKLETVGRLAGGIAHDFNNLLTVIIGNAALLADAPGLTATALAEVEAIRTCGSRAAVLTDQLLSFSRRKILQPKVFDLNDLVVDLDRMLARLLGERIRILVRTAPEPCAVRADSAEIGRVLLNLCINARDAMPTGGVLSIETSWEVLHEAAAAERGVPPGRYVRLLVADTGVGMTEETRQHVFEPFFTTKEISHGAGLGLATALGIVQQSAGILVCESVLGEGSRFEVWLPGLAAADAEAPADDRDVRPLRPGSSEVVLLVEDEDGVRGLTRRVLERAGYVVLEAADGREALGIINGGETHIDILVSDVLMPGMSGGVLVSSARHALPALKVLFVSGYAEDVLVREGIAQGTAFLSKPYSPSSLLRKVQEVLQEGDEPLPEPAA